MLSMAGQLGVLVVAAFTDLFAVASVDVIPGEVPSDVKFEWISEEEYKAAKKKAKPMLHAQRQFHRHFPPWTEHNHVIQSHKKAAARARKSMVSARRLQGLGTRRLARLTKAALSAMQPHPAVAACMHLMVDMTALGFPGVYLSLGLEGELRYDLCSSCFRWKFQTMLGFNVGVRVLGYGVYFKVALRGELDLKELQCDLAKDSYFCQFLHIVLPEHVNRQRDRDQRCHSDSPFEVIDAYVRWQWITLRDWVHERFYGEKAGGYRGSLLEQRLQMLETELLRYPKLFQVAAPVPALQATANFDENGGGQQGFNVKLGSLRKKSRRVSIKVSASSSWEEVSLWGYETGGRICWNQDVPSFIDLENGSPYSSAALRVICANSIRLKDIVTDANAIAIAGDVVTITSRALEDPVQIRCLGQTEGFPSAVSDAEALHNDIIAWLHQTRILSQNHVSTLLATCHSAILNPPDGGGTYSPYCSIEYQGTGKGFGHEWSSSYDYRTNTPVWNETVGLKLLTLPVGGGQATPPYPRRFSLNVRVHDWSDTHIDRITKWFTWRLTTGILSTWGFLSGTPPDGNENANTRGAGDPLSDYIGMARITLCAPEERSVGNLDSEWTRVSATMGCHQSTDIDISFEAAIELPSSLPHAERVPTCQRICEHFPGCYAIDYMDQGVPPLPWDSTWKIAARRCSLFSQQCQPHQLNTIDSSHYVMNSAAVDLYNWDDNGREYRTVRGPTCDAEFSRDGTAEATVKLVQGKNHYRSEAINVGNWASWYKGIEIIDKGSITMKFRWENYSKAISRPAWNPQNDGGRLLQQDPPSLPHMTDAARAMFSGLDSMLMKLPDYSRQVRKRLETYDPNDQWGFEDGQLDYTNLDGRFFARWDPFAQEKFYSLEFGATPAPTPPPEAWTPEMCNSLPDNADTPKQMFCNVNSLFGSGNTWKQVLSEWWNRLLKSPPCSGAELSVDTDDRVVHFDRALKQSTYANNPATTVDFYAEMATSVMNLFIRVVADVQALWSTYFADEPTWNGDCSSLKPGFQLAYEFDEDVMWELTQMGDQRFAYMMRTQSLGKDMQTWPLYRAKTLVSQGERRPMDDAGDTLNVNPWCTHMFAGGRKGQHKRIDFLKHDAPVHGKDDFVTDPRDSAAHMYPHLWCLALRGYRNQSQPDPAAFWDGIRLSYESSCQQIRRVQANSDPSCAGSTCETETLAKTWKRYDCEEVLVTSTFVTFFPAFVKSVIGTASPRGANLDQTGWFGRIGTVIEDILQCAGRITPRQREFQRRPIDQVNISANSNLNVDLDCVGTQAQLDALQSNTGALYKRLKAFIEEQTSEAMRIMREFLDWLESEDTNNKFSDDFKRLFRFHDIQDSAGTLMTGEAWLKGLDTAKEDLGTMESVRRLIDKYKSQAVLQAWNSLSASQRRVTALFPLPVQYRSLWELQVGFASEEANICQKSIPTQLTFAVRYIGKGKTWDYYNNGQQTKVCIEGLLAPIPFIPMAAVIEGCFGRRPDAAGGQYEQSWRIGLKAVVKERVRSLIDAFASLTPSLSEAISKHAVGASPLGGGVADEMNDNIVWQIARQILLDPRLLFEGVMLASSAINGQISALEFASGAVQKLGDSIARNIIFIAADVAGWASREILAPNPSDVNPFFDLQTKQLDIFEAHVELSRVGDVDEWIPSFGVYYQQRASVGLQFDIPLFAAVKTDVSLTSYYDLSEVFAVMFDGHSMPLNYYDCCMLCLGSTGYAYCRDENGIPHCFNKSAPDLPSSCTSNVTVMSSCHEQEKYGIDSLPRYHRQNKACMNSRDKGSQTFGAWSNTPDAVLGLTTASAMLEDPPTPPPPPPPMPTPPPTSADDDRQGFHSDWYSVAGFAHQTRSNCIGVLLLLWAFVCK